MKQLNLDAGAASAAEATKAHAIPAESYVSIDLFDQEMRRIFAKGFQFVSLTTDLANNRDFVCLDHAGGAVVVQNFKGEIKAFQNVCTHRFNKIQVEERGNRPLSCMYHGWTFDAQGCPLGVAKRPDYMAGGVGMADLCLPQYSIETVGKFVFVNLGDDGRTLREFLGSAYEDLEEIGRHIGAEVLHETLSHNENWKRLTENLIDGQHSGPGDRGSERLCFSATRSADHLPRTGASHEESRTASRSTLESGGDNDDLSSAIHIFPNLYVDLRGDCGLYLAQMLPVAGQQTRLKWRAFELLPNVREGFRITLAKERLAGLEMRTQKFFSHYGAAMSAT